MARTDIHRPSAINPVDYSYVACFYFGPWAGDFNRQSTAVLKAHKERTGGKTSDHEHGGSCHVCGAHAHYLVCFYHKDTNTYIYTGEDCANKMDKGEMALFRKGVLKTREVAKNLHKAGEILAQHNATECLEIFNKKDWDDVVANSYELRTHNDIIGKLVKYGQISDRALSFAQSLAKKIPMLAQKKAEELAKRAAEAESAEACPQGRVTIVGTVLSVKQTDWGLNILVQAKQGFKVYGSRPSGAVGSHGEYADIVRGANVVFKATVTPSDKDAKFGFFKRPANPKVITDPEESEHMGFKNV